MKKMNIEKNKLTVEVINEMSGKLNDIIRAINYIDDNGYDNGYFYPLMDAANCINDVCERLEGVCSLISLGDGADEI